MKRRRRKKLQRLLVSVAGFGTARRVGELLRAGADPDLPGRDGTTPLYRAAVQGRSANVRALVAAGADPNRESGTGEDGLPLCGAACWGHDDAVRELLAAGADPLLREDGGHGRTALDWAEAGGHRTTAALMSAVTTRPPRSGDGT
ncbi:ankyrin repeat domain-containing protein [Actinoplanes sp. NPDC023801]|uniref:ankyrin repeat domain-containing protein n=1 Tax=Actinoplanes sp. NPDC023801 TaxID=3154595 RepID=UPI0033DDF905